MQAILKHFRLIFTWLGALTSLIRLIELDMLCDAIVSHPTYANLDRFRSINPNVNSMTKNNIAYANRRAHHASTHRKDGHWTRTLRKYLSRKMCTKCSAIECARVASRLCCAIFLAIFVTDYAAFHTNVSTPRSIEFASNSILFLPIYLRSTFYLDQTSVTAL